MKRKVVVTGYGCVSGLGIDVTETWARALSGNGAIRRLTRDAPPDHPSRAMEGPAAWIDPGSFDNLIATEDLRRFGHLDPLSLYALAAAVEAVDEAGLRGHHSLATRTAVVLGCGSGGNTTVDVAYERLYGRGLAKVHPQTIPSSMISAPASHIAMLLGIHGPTFVVAGACASSAQAIGEAMHMIRAGRADVAIAGGSEACLNLGSWVGWKSLGVMANDTCRPFSKERSGMVLSEGAAIVILESEEHAQARGATILGELAGYGSSSDARDMTAPDPAGIQMAIQSAHEDAALPFHSPALISGHGTGTRLNDRAEAEVVRAVYGDSLSKFDVIATKSAHGHLIGATAALEFIIGMKALNTGIAPPILNYQSRDPECDLPLVLTAKPIDHEVLISNSFAFGGLNAVLIGKRYA